MLQENPSRAKYFSSEQLKITAEALHTGIRNRYDPVTWRTMSIDMRRLLGSPNPERVAPTAPLDDAIELVEYMTEGTYLSNLLPEILYSLDYDPPPELIADKKLDALIISARHGPEELVWSLADDLAVNRNNQIAVINPIGHYDDKHSRILGPRKIFHQVDQAVFLTSTQELFGGRLGVLNESLELLSESEFSSQIKRIAVVIPMIGGSRGHKEGQAYRIGSEVLQMRSIPDRLSDLVSRIQDRLWIQAPIISFYSVDVHNPELPRSVFEGRGYSFTSIGPEKPFADAIKREISDFQNVALRLVAVDRGAVLRTEALAEELLRIKVNGCNSVDVVEIKKIRNSAGQVESAHVENLVRMHIKDGKVIREMVDISALTESSEGFIRITTDDILDTGRSAKKDDELLNTSMPGSLFKISVATHAVMSAGIASALDNTGSDVVMVSNSLPNSELSKDKRKRVRVVNIGPAVADTLFPDSVKAK